jgi:hypothetical protein
MKRAGFCGQQEEEKPVEHPADPRLRFLFRSGIMVSRSMGILPVLLLGIAFGGCVEKVKPGEASSGASSTSGGMVAQNPEPSTSDPKDNNGRIVPDAANPPTAAADGAVPLKDDPAAPPKDNSALAKKVADLEGKLKKNPNDPAVKKQLAEALYQQGYAIMTDDSIMPRQKYGPALKLYNRALALDPTNQGAKENKALIENIYKQMGRPIPQ